MVEKLTIPLGETWEGFEFINIHRYKRKTGYKIICVRRYWSGKFRTIATEYARTADEIIQKINNKILLPIFKLPKEEEERIRDFVEGKA